VKHYGQSWPAVGHGASTGSSNKTPFGLDFLAANKLWTVELCQMDSDGDGMTNGEELGDPNCTWQVGQTPTRTINISHPGLVTETVVEMDNDNNTDVDVNNDDGEDDDTDVDVNNDDGEDETDTDVDEQTT
jgi:hypothetical protein